MSTCQYLWSSCSVDPLVVPTGWSFCWYISARVRGAKSLHSNRWKAVLVLSSLIQKAYNNIFFECFVALACSGPFQTFFKVDILPTCDIFDHLKDRLVTQARQFPFPWQCWLHIEYEYWKWLAHWNIKGPACETKPTFCKQKQKLPSSNKHELMVQRSLIDAIK